MEPTIEIKKAMEEKKLIIGTKETIKKLKQGKIAKVFVSLNCPGDVKDDLHHLCTVSKTLTADVGVPNNELGIICKKPFSISVVSVSKEQAKK